MASQDDANTDEQDQGTERRRAPVMKYMETGSEPHGERERDQPERPGEHEPPPGSRGKRSSASGSATIPTAQTRAQTRNTSSIVQPAKSCVRMPQLLRPALRQAAGDVDSHLDCVIHVPDLVPPRSEPAARMDVVRRQPRLDHGERLVTVQRGDRGRRSRRRWCGPTRSARSHRGARWDESVHDVLLGRLGSPGRCRE